jgi:hypothetical protein
MGEGKERVKHEWKNIFLGKTPEGRSRFEKRKVPVLKPGQTPPQPPDMNILPPQGEVGSVIEKNQTLEETPKPASTLHPVKDIGIPKWQEKDLKD